MISYSNLIHNLDLFEFYVKRHNRRNKVPTSVNSPAVSNPGVTTPAFNDIPIDIRAFCWLPQYHDMGLIANYLLIFFKQGRGHFMSPFSFLKSPPLWLHSMWRFSCNGSFAPNFAFALVLRKWKTLPVPDGFSLKGVNYFAAGGEANLRETFEAFEEFFCSTHNLRSEGIVSCYGMAEHVVGINIDTSNPSRSFSTKDPRRLCCGIFDDEVRKRFKLKLRIVDPDSLQVLEEGEHGEILLQSPSVAMGYYGNKKKTDETFHAKIATAGQDKNTQASNKGFWLRTGDIGYVEGTKLYFVSRKKDLLIIRGRNYAPKDLECVADSVLGVRPGCTIVFSVASGGTEQAVMLTEVRSKGELAKLGITPSEIVSKLRAAISSSEGINLEDVVLLKARTIPKTSSGKLRRSEAKKLYMTSALDAVYWPLKNCMACLHGAIETEKKDNGINFAKVNSPLDMKSALSLALGSGFDWETMADDEFGSIIDSLQLVEISVALKENFGIIFESDVLLLHVTSKGLVELVRGFCEQQCKINDSKNWREATSKLPRNPGEKGACVITEEMMEDPYRESENRNYYKIHGFSFLNRYLLSDGSKSWEMVTA